MNSKIKLKERNDELYAEVKNLLVVIKEQDTKIEAYENKIFALENTVGQLDIDNISLKIELQKTKENLYQKTIAKDFNQKLKRSNDASITK